LKDISLVLGTVQLGIPYGIANRSGQPDMEKACAIIQTAWQNGIREFDTAQGYGNSEQILGQVLGRLRLSDRVRIISKFNPELNHLNRSHLEDALNDSLRKLGVSNLFCMMLHCENHLDLWEKGLKDIMKGFVSAGKIKHVGVSVYSPDRARQALNKDGIEVVQVPTNLLDGRFLQMGFFTEGAEKKKKIYIRSVFLQGLLLMRATDLPKTMAFSKTAINAIDLLCQKWKINRLQLALGYLKHLNLKSKIIFGAESPQQIVETVRVWKENLPKFPLSEIQELSHSIDERIINPSLWHS